MNNALIAVDVNSKAVISNLESLLAKVGPATLKALEDTADEALRLSQFEVPHDEGTLQNSGTVEIVGDGVVMGYHTPYAARLHEHPEYRFQKGRKGKYIDDPLRRNQNALNIVFGKEFQMRLF